MDTQQTNVLLPSSTTALVGGPLIFNQSNPVSSNSGRTTINEKTRELIGHPQGDLQKQVGRYFYVATLQWESSFDGGHLLFKYTTDDLISASPALSEIMEYYRQIRASPTLRVTVSGNAAQAGQMVIIFVPSGAPEIYEGIPSWYPYVLLRPQEHSVAEVKGHYIKHLRADDTSYHPLDFGYFKGIVQNRLRSPASTPQAVTLIVHVKFEAVSLQVYKAPSTSSKLERFKRYFKALPEESKQKFYDSQTPHTKAQETNNFVQGGKAGSAVSSALRSITEFARKRGATTGFTKGGVIDTIADVVDTAGKIAGGIGKLLPLGGLLFHSPTRPFADEMAIGDRPKTACRLQFSQDHVCPPDPTVGQMADLYKLMDITTLLQLPSRESTFSWSDTDTVGTVLFTTTANPNKAPIWSRFAAQVPAFFRGTVTLDFQAIKTIHHQGQLLIQVQTIGAEADIANSQLGISQIFDIASAEQCEISIPWGYGQDFVDELFGQFFQVTVTVLCMLQTTNTTSTIDVNIWRKVGADFQFIGGPTQATVASGNISRVPSITPRNLVEPSPIATTKGLLGEGGAGIHRDTDPITGTSTGAPSTQAQQEELDPVTVQSTVGPRTIDPINKPSETHPLYDTQAQPQAGWSGLHESNLKIAAHRPQHMNYYFPDGVPKPVIVKAGPYTDNTAYTAPTILFQASQADLLRLVPQSANFAYLSGGVRLSWILSAPFTTPGIIEVRVGLRDGSQRYDYFPISRYQKHTVEIPYYEQTPAIPLLYNALIHNDAQEIDQIVRISLMPATQKESPLINFTMYFFIAAADDYAGQQPIPFTTPGFKGPVEMVQYVDIPSTPPEDFDGLTDVPVSTSKSHGMKRLEFIAKTPTRIVETFEPIVAPSPGIELPHTKAEETDTVKKYWFRPYSDHLPAINQRIEELSNSEDEEPEPKEGVFPIESDRLKTFSQQFTDTGKPLTHCHTRIHHTVHHADVCLLRARSKKIRTFGFCKDSNGDQWIHYHTDIQCIAYKPHPDDPIHLSHHKAAFAAAFFRKADLDSIVPVPFVETHVPFLTPTRKHGKKFSKTIDYFTAIGTTIFTTRGPAVRNPEKIWGGLPHMKGVFQWLMGSKIQEKTEEAADVFTDRVEANFKQKFEEFTLSHGKTLGSFAEGLGLRFAAYIAQFASVRTYGQWVATLLFILSDIHLVFSKTPIIPKIVEAIKSVATRFLGLFYRPEDDGMTEFREYPMYDSGEEYLPKTKADEGQTWYDSVTSVFQDIATNIFGVAVNAHHHIIPVLKEVGLVGNAVRGIQSLILGLKAFFVWLGLSTDEVKESISAFQAYISDPDVAEAVIEMQYHCKISCQSLLRESIRVTQMRDIARRISVLAAGLRDPAILRVKEIAQQYLKHTQPVSSTSRSDTHFEPVFAIFEGEAGQGKTIGMERVARSITKALGREENDYYAGVLDADYFTGYVDQPVVVFDDLFQDPKGEKVPYLTQLISSTETPIPQADIESKGCVSSARVIMATTNSSYIKTDWTVKPEAVYRRFKDSHFLLQEGKYYRVLWQKSNTSQQLEKKPFSSYPEMTIDEVARYIWDLYLAKWQRHITLRDMPVIELTPATGDAACQRPADIVKANEEEKEKKAKEKQRPMKMEKLPVPPEPLTQLAAPAISCNKAAWESGGLDKIHKDALYLHDAKYPNTTANPVPVPHPLYTYYGPMWNPYNHILLTGAYKLPYIEVEPASGQLMGQVKEIKQKLRKLSKEKFEIMCNYLMVQGAKRDQLVACAPVMSCFYDRCQDAMSYVKSCSKIFKVTAAFLALVVTCVVVSKYSSTSKATYQPRAVGNVQTRLAYGRPATAPVQTSKGLEDKLPIIEKYMVDWWYLKPEGKKVQVKGLLIGGKCVLTVAHAVRPGMQHGFTWKTSESTTMDVPILVTPTNFSTTKNQGLDLDIAVVYFGSSFPNTKDLTNYFVGETSLESLPTGPATVLLSKPSHPVQRIKTTQHFEFNKALVNMIGNNTLRQNQFTVPIGAPDGSCGSPLITNDKTRDGRIIGILNGGTDFTTSFVPVTSELIIHLKGIINMYAENPAVPDGTSLVDRAVTKARQTSQMIVEEDPTHQLPRQPVHMDIEPEPQPECMVNVKTAYHPTRVRHAPLFKFGDRKPALRSLSNMKVLHPLTHDQDPRGLRVPGDQFLVSRNKIEVDGHIVQASILTVTQKLAERIPSATLLTESEVVNGYCKYSAEGPYENKGFPTSTSIGHTSKALGFGPSKRDVLQDRQDGTRELIPKFRSYTAYIEKQMLEGKEFRRIISLNLKDELRDREKTEVGKIRLFCAEDAILVYLMTKYFGHFMDQYRALPLEYWHTLGKDPAQIWGRLGTFLGNEVISADGKNWDMSLQGFHFECARLVIENFYQNDTTRTPQQLEDDARIRVILLDHVCYSITGYNKRQYMSTGMKSGIYATTEFNTLIQTIIIIYHSTSILYEHTGLTLLESAREAKAHRFVSNGDDNMHSDPSFCAKTLYAQELPKTYGKFGITITSSNKSDLTIKFQPIQEATYLRRGFNKDNYHNYYFPSMENTTLTGLIYYFRRTTTEIENLLEAFTFARQGNNAKQYYALKYIAKEYYPELEEEKYGWRQLEQNYNPPEHDKGLMAPIACPVALHAEISRCPPPTNIMIHENSEFGHPTAMVHLLKYVYQTGLREVTVPHAEMLITHKLGIYFAIEHTTPHAFTKLHQARDRTKFTLINMFQAICDIDEVDRGSIERHLREQFDEHEDKPLASFVENVACEYFEGCELSYVAAFMEHMHFNPEVVKCIVEYCRTCTDWNEEHMGVVDPPDFGHFQAVYLTDETTWDDIYALQLDYNQGSHIGTFENFLRPDTDSEPDTDDDDYPDTTVLYRELLHQGETLRDSPVYGDEVGGTYNPDDQQITYESDEEQEEGASGYLSPEEMLKWLREH